MLVNQVFGDLDFGKQSTLEPWKPTENSPSRMWWCGMHTTTFQPAAMAASDRRPWRGTISFDPGLYPWP